MAAQVKDPEARVFDPDGYRIEAVENGQPGDSGADPSPGFSSPPCSQPPDW